MNHAVVMLPPLQFGLEDAMVLRNRSICLNPGLSLFGPAKTNVDRNSRA